MNYYPDYDLIKKYVFKSPIPQWIKKVLLRDDEFLHDAQQTIDLHRLFPTRFPLRKEIKELIDTYKKQAFLTQKYINNKK